MLGRAACVDDRCAQLAERVATLRAPQQTHEGFVHGDLHDKQLFLAGDAAWLIDLEGCSRGDSNFDLVNLAEHLRLRALQRHGKDDGLCDSFLDRFAISRELRMAWGLCIRSRLIGVYAMRPRHAQVVAALFHSVAANLLERP
jgi:Phosphotransferase enzyme family